ncbi:fibronectin type III domain-containing protein [Paenibacillus chitinolyticus]
MDLNWNSTGAKSYKVKRSVSPGGPYALLASDLTSTTYTDTTVTNGVTYYYVVTAVNEAGESVPSPEKSIKPEATKYTGGLLDRLWLKTGPAVNNPTGTERVMTDNDATTRYLLTPGILVWHTFQSPKEINSVLIQGTGGVTVEFYDANDNLLSSYTPITLDGVESLPTPVKNVTTALLKKNTNAFVNEWNLFESPSAKPLPTVINWIQAGDRTVDLYWDSKGAKSYNVRRSVTKGGPYALVANTKELSFTDTTVTNGTTYYYVVTSVNEAGESAPSAEKEIKPDATKYTGGLLDRKILKTGTAISNPTGAERIMTDNNIATQFVLRGMAWYNFDTPKNIESVIVNGSSGAIVEFYDTNSNLLFSYTPAQNDTVETLAAPVKNVSVVVLKHSNGFVKEWNVFGKAVEPPVAAPLNLTATGGDKKVTLAWNSVNNATSYNVKRSTTAGGPYVTVGSVTGATYTYTDTNVVNGTTYYYVVTAVAPAGESAPSNEASATPKAGDVVIPPEEESGDSAILVITLNNGTEKEYDLSMNEVNAFIAWYEGRAAGKGPVMFAIDKHENNKGPFKNRKDYILYDKIITFEVNAYDNGKGGNGGTTPPVNPEDPSNY